MNRSTASVNERKRKREDDDGVDNRSLYLCFDEEFCAENKNTRYSVRAIKLSDLFVFSDTTTVIYPSRFKSMPEDCDALRDVAFVGRDDGSVLPVSMGFGVYGSQIVLVGGLFWDERRFKCVPRISYALDTTDPKPSFQESGEIPAVRGHAMLHRPHLQEIDGKLYALSSDCFVVFDPHCESNQFSETKLWTLLPRLPWGYPISCSFLGRKIIVPVNGRSMFCYDLDDGTWTEIEKLLRAPGSRLIVDCEDDFDKLMFSFERPLSILVRGMWLSTDGVPTHCEDVALIELPELPSLSDSVLRSWMFAYLGDGKVCVALLYLNHFDCQPLRVFTFKFAYTKAGAAQPPDISSSSTSDPSSLHYESYFGSFSATALGCRLFEFRYAEQCPPKMDLSNCFVM